MNIKSVRMDNDAKPNKNALDEMLTQVQHIKQELHQDELTYYDLNHDLRSFKDAIVFKEDLDNLYKNHTFKEEMSIGPEVLQHAEDPQSTRDRICYEDDNDDIEKDNQLSEQKCKPVYNCACGKSYTCKTKFNLHSNNCFNEFICDYCQEQFTLRSAIERHIKIHMKKKPTKLQRFEPWQPYEQSCVHCKKKFRLKESLEKHMEIHKEGGDGSYQCGVCEKDYTTKAGLKHHVLIHLDTKPSYACDKCDKVYSRKESYKIHYDRDHLGIVTISKPRPKRKKPILDLICDYCQKTFRYKSNLQHHIMLHMGLRHSGRMYVKKKAHCDICTRIFANKSSLKLHMDTKHLKKYKYFCSMCKIGTNRKWYLNKFHENNCHKKPNQTYSSENKNYRCKLCPNTYKKSCGLRLHMDSVHLDIKFCCKRCNKSYTRKYSLQCHETKCT